MSQSTPRRLQPRPAGLTSRAIRSHEIERPAGRRRRRARRSRSPIWTKITSLLPRRRTRRRQPKNWTAIASVIAALAAAAGVYFTGLSLDASREQNKVAQEQNKVAQQGQETDRLAQAADRFTRAVDQLDRAGPDHLQGRVGAVYALEQLARDSPGDHWTIMEVLTAFIRTTTPQPTPAGPPGGRGVCPEHITADIQAALTVLGRRDYRRENSVIHKINLSNLCLRGADLHGGYFADASFYNTDLSHAILVFARFMWADLRDIDLRGTALFAADLRGASVTGAVYDEATNVINVKTDKRTIGEWW